MYCLDKALFFAKGTAPQGIPLRAQRGPGRLSSKHSLKDCLVHACSAVLSAGTYESTAVALRPGLLQLLLLLVSRPSFNDKGGGM